MSMNPNADKIVKRACVFAGLGGLLFGLDQGYINGSLSYICTEMKLTMEQGESYASIMLIGCVIGALGSGWISRAIGRKKTLIISSIFFTAFTLFGAITSNLFILFATRFALGLAVGCASFIVPLYLSEIAPTRLRGGFISMYQFMIALGIFLIYLSNSVIGAYFQSWRLMLGIIALPAVIMFFGVLGIPKSPRWLMLKNREKEAREVLEKTRGTMEEVEFELGEIRQSIEDGKKQSGWKMLKKGYFVKILILGMCIMLLQQFCGINAVIYYSGEIFKVAGFPNAAVATVVMGLINVFVTIIAIKYIDKWGRKPIIYFGLTVMTITLIIAGSLFKMQESGEILSNSSKYLLLASCLIYVASFAVSLGPIAWVMCAEIFPLEGRDFGITVTTSTIWIGCTIVVRFTLSIIHNFGGSVLFFIFAAVCIMGFYLTKFYTPETKGVSLEEIEMNLKAGKRLKDIGA